jgi:hypothetical protein
LIQRHEYSRAVYTAPPLEQTESTDTDNIIGNKWKRQMCTGVWLSYSEVSSCLPVAKMSFGVFTDLYTIGHIEMPDCKWKRYLTSLDKWKFAVNCHV